MKFSKSRLNAHLAACASVAIASGVLGAAHEANAAIVWSGVVNIAIPSNTDGVYLNVVTGQNGATGTGVAGWDVNPYGGSSLSFFQAAGGGYIRNLGSSTTLVDNLAFGTQIGPASTFGSGTSGAETAGATAFLPGSMSNLVGFRFVNEATGLTHYGWMRILLGGSGLASQPRAIIEYAYENIAGVGIGAGQIIPAPGALALLGLAALTSRRRRG
jgi:hypothetical protein